MTVASVTDAAEVTANDVGGSEDSPINLDLAATTGTTGDSIASVVITGVPGAATLSAGTDNGDGTWTVDAADLGSLTITPATNFSGTMSLGIDVTTTDGSDTAVASESFEVTVTPVADNAVLAANDVVGNEDEAIALDLSASLVDSSETYASILVSGVPSGATLSAGTDNGDGTWSLSHAQLTGLTVTPPSHFSGTMNLSLDVTSQDGSDTTLVTDAFSVTVTGVADSVSLTANDVGGNEDTTIALDLGASLVDTSETISAVTITGVPTGASLSHGVDNGDGTWSLDVADLGSVTFTPAADASGTMSLGIDVETTDGADTEVTSSSFDVTVTAIADDANLTANDVTGNEDEAIALSLSTSVADGSETITSVVLSGVPSGATLSAGIDNGDGTWNVDPADLAALTVTPPAHFSGSLGMSIDVTTQDGADTTVTSESFTVTVDAVADQASITANDVGGSEDSPAIALDLGVSLVDSGETLESVTITGVPAGASLSTGTDNGDGTWTVDAADLASLSFAPETNFSGTTTLGIEVVTEDNGDRATTISSFDVTVTAVADAAVITANDVSGHEDGTIALSLGAATADASESIDEVLVTGLPRWSELVRGHRQRRRNLDRRSERSLDSHVHAAFELRRRTEPGPLRHDL